VVADLDDGRLWVGPDLLPRGSVRIGAVWVDGEPWERYDAEQLTVDLAGVATDRAEVRVRLRPSTAHMAHLTTDFDGSRATISLRGAFDADAVRRFEGELHNAVVERGARTLVVLADGVDELPDTAARALVLVRQQADAPAVWVVGGGDAVRSVCREADPTGRDLRLVDTADDVDAG
jgi:hypothetical protein